MIVMNGLHVTYESHVEKIHGSTLNWLLNQAKDLPGDQFKVLDLEIPLEGEVPHPFRSLVGPSCGDRNVTEDEVYYAVRSGAADRTWVSRLVDWEPTQTRFVRAICVPVKRVVKDGYADSAEAPEGTFGTVTKLVLATAYGISKLGEETAPPDLHDPDLSPGKRLAHLLEAARAFWQTHALCQKK
jgi:hypothetical protein